MTTLSGEIFSVSPIPAAPGGRLAIAGRWFHRSEELLIAIILFVLILLPLVEATLRKFLHTGISGATSFEQHLTLVIAMLGGAIAAREGRLLSMSTLDALLRGHWRTVTAVLTRGYAAAVTLLLAYGAFLFFREEHAAVQLIGYGIPTWAMVAVIPAGFAVIAVRLVKAASANWWPRVATALSAVAIVATALYPPLEPSQMLIPGAILLAIAAVLGAPIYSVIGGAALLLFWANDVTIAAITVDHYRLVTNPTLPSVPLFTLAGFFLAAGGASRRLVRLFQALIGRIRGGSAILTTLICAFFTSFTGASGVTILALGGLLLPVLVAARYSEKTAIGLLTATGSLGLLFPPCLPLIFYAVIAQVDIREMFLGGLLPGLLLVIMTAAWGISQSPRREEGATAFDWREAATAAWIAKWELMLPVVAFAGLFGGFATPVEAAALTAFYAFVAEAFIYRDLHFGRELIGVMRECGLLIGGVLLILGVAMGFTNFLVDAQLPARTADWVGATIHSPLLFLLLLNLFLIVVGALMDIYSAIVVVVPLIVPIGLAFGIDPIHLGIIFLANAELGFLMPPVGENLFLASYRFGKPVPEVFRAVIPMVLVYLAGVLLITYVPALTTFLPNLLR